MPKPSHQPKRYLTHIHPPIDPSRGMGFLTLFDWLMGMATQPVFVVMIFQGNQQYTCPPESFTQMYLMVAELDESAHENAVVILCAPYKDVVYGLTATYSHGRWHAIPPEVAQGDIQEYHHLDWLDEFPEAPMIRMADVERYRQAEEQEEA
jgi:hypothetical protein